MQPAAQGWQSTPPKFSEPGWAGAPYNVTIMLRRTYSGNSSSTRADSDGSRTTIASACPGRAGGRGGAQRPCRAPSRWAATGCSSSSGGSPAATELSLFMTTRPLSRPWRHDGRSTLLPTTAASASTAREACSTSACAAWAHAYRRIFDWELSLSSAAAAPARCTTTTGSSTNYRSNLPCFVPTDPSYAALLGACPPDRV